MVDLFIVGGSPDVFQKSTSSIAISTERGGVESSLEGEVDEVIRSVLTLLHLTVHRACIPALPIYVVHFCGVCCVLCGMVV